MALRGSSDGRRVVTVILDGLRRDFVRPDLMPTLCSLRERGAWFTRHRTVFPSCTRVISASISTGCWPSRHGLAGNTVCLRDADQLVLQDVGRPEFLDVKRRLDGSVLRRPTLAERLHAAGGSIVFNNVSPGAAYMHDPDGYGHVYHRAGSFGPGRKAITGSAELDVAPDAAGDRLATTRFAAEIVGARRPAHALLWLAEPDTTQHAVPLGSEAHHHVLRAADENVALVLSAVERARRAGDEILFLVGSDHGHETIIEVIDIAAELIAAGLKESLDSSEVVVAPNGTAALIYADIGTFRIDEIARFLARQEWAGEVFSGDRIPEAARLPGGGGLAFAVAMAGDDQQNSHGIPGRSYAARPAAGKAFRVGCGMHGGLGRYEQSPMLVMDGAMGNRVETAASSVIDLAPTILDYLGLTPDGLDGRSLLQN